MREIWTREEAVRRAAVNGGTDSVKYGSEFDGMHIIDVFCGLMEARGLRAARLGIRAVIVNREAAYDSLL